MKNVLKTLFIAVIAMSISFAYAQGDKKLKKTDTKSQVSKKDDKVAKKPAAKKPTSKPAAKQNEMQKKN